MPAGGARVQQPVSLEGRRSQRHGSVVRIGRVVQKRHESRRRPTVMMTNSCSARLTPRDRTNTTPPRTRGVADRPMLPFTACLPFLPVDVRRVMSQSVECTLFERGRRVVKRTTRSLCDVLTARAWWVPMSFSYSSSSSPLSCPLFSLPSSASVVHRCKWGLSGTPAAMVRGRPNYPPRERWGAAVPAHEARKLRKVPSHCASSRSEVILRREMPGRSDVSKQSMRA